jgi:hypothetical protein
MREQARQIGGEFAGDGSVFNCNPPGCSPSEPIGFLKLSPRASEVCVS